MVATLATQRFFHKPDDEVWHAYREDSTTALCGQAQLSYNVDTIADVVPADATLHGPCAAVLRGDKPEPEQPAVTSTPKAKGKTKAKG